MALLPKQVWISCVSKFYWIPWFSPYHTITHDPKWYSTSFLKHFGISRSLKFDESRDDRVPCLFHDRKTNLLPSYRHFTESRDSAVVPDSRPFGFHRHSPIQNIYANAHHTYWRTFFFFFRPKKLASFLISQFRSHSKKKAIIKRQTRKETNHAIIKNISR